MRQPTFNGKFGTETYFCPGPIFPAGTLVLLVGSFFYVGLRVEPMLEYHSYGPFFYRHWEFFETFVSRPGGLASYAGIFLAQLNSMNFLGALVFVLLEGMLFLMALVCLARISGRAPGFFAWLPLFVLLVLRNHYGCPVLAIGVGLVLALAGTGLCLWRPWRRRWLATIVSGLISGFIFYVAGLWSAGLFAVLVCLDSLIKRGNWALGMGALLFGLAWPALGIGVGGLERAELIHPWPKGSPGLLVGILYAAVPVAVVLMAGLPKPVDNPLASGWRWGSRVAWRGQAWLVLAFGFGWAVVWLAFDQRQKVLAKIDYATSYGRYEAVIAAARQLKTLNHSAMIRLHLALYHTGRLAEDLFLFQNMIEPAAFEGIGEACRAQSESLFQLGLINDAEHMAYEALQMEGDRPDLLRLLARINLLKDQPQAAQVFLNVLSLIPFQGERANEGWPTADPQISAREREFLAGLRARVLTHDVLHDGLPVGRLLGVLLTSNPTNQMAFEYLMADYLMDLDLKQVVEHLRLLDNFKYAHIPSPYEEAVLLFQQLAGVEVDLKGRTIRPETAERFRRFKTAVSQLAGTDADKVAMRVNFGDTYWYYYAVRSRERESESQGPTP